jgi:sec-independent protein translocase protein TatA
MWEMVLIFMVVLLLFGAKRLPEIGSSLGKGIREFKGSLREIEREIQISDEEPPRSVPPKHSGSEGGEEEEEDNPRRLTPSP